MQDLESNPPNHHQLNKTPIEQLKGHPIEGMKLELQADESESERQMRTKMQLQMKCRHLKDDEAELVGPYSSAAASIEMEQKRMTRGMESVMDEKRTAVVAAVACRMTAVALVVVVDATVVVMAFDYAGMADIEVPVAAAVAAAVLRMLEYLVPQVVAVIG